GRIGKAALHESRHEGKWIVSHDQEQVCVVADLAEGGGHGSNFTQDRQIAKQHFRAAMIDHAACEIGEFQRSTGAVDICGKPTDDRKSAAPQYARCNRDRLGALAWCALDTRLCIEGYDPLKLFLADGACPPPQEEAALRD